MLNCIHIFQTFSVYFVENLIRPDIMHKCKLHCHHCQLHFVIVFHLSFHVDVDLEFYT